MTLNAHVGGDIERQESEGGYRLRVDRPESLELVTAMFSHADGWVRRVRRCCTAVRVAGLCSLQLMSRRGAAHITADFQHALTTDNQHQQRAHSAASPPHAPDAQQRTCRATPSSPATWRANGMTTGSKGQFMKQFVLLTAFLFGGAR